MGGGKYDGHTTLTACSGVGDEGLGAGKQPDIGYNIGPGESRERILVEGPQQDCASSMENGLSVHRSGIYTVTTESTAHSEENNPVEKSRDLTTEARPRRPSGSFTQGSENSMDHGQIVGKQENVQLSISFVGV